MYTNKVIIPSKSYSPVYIDDRFKSPYTINVRHNESCEILRFHSQQEAGRMQDHLAKHGYTLYDTKEPVENPQRYISLTIAGVGILVIDAHTATLLRRYPITPHYKRKVRKYVGTLNAQEAQAA